MAVGHLAYTYIFTHTLPGLEGTAYYNTPYYNLDCLTHTYP